MKPADIESLKRHFPRTLARFALVLTAGIILATNGFGNAAPDAEDVGLRGIFPNEPPEGLYFDAFTVLDGKWTEWGEDVAAQVGTLYEEELDLAGQKKVVETLASKVRVMDRALSDERFAILFDRLIPLRGRLARRVELAQAILDTLEADPEAIKHEKMQAAAEDVVQAVEALERELGEIRGGDAWLTYLKTADLSDAMSAAKLPPASHALLKNIQKKTTVGKNWNDDQKKFVSAHAAAFGRLSDSIDAYRATASMKLPKADPQALRSELATLVKAIETYEADNSAAAAAEIHASAGRLTKLGGPAVDPVSEVLSQHYLNRNLRIVASEEFMSRLVYEERTEEGTVQDYVLGANVYGNQWTTASSGIDLKPAKSFARFDVKVQGVTQSSTVGVTSHADVYTQGYHQFWAYKEVRFDGKRFTTKPGRINVNANNQTTDADTSIGWIPIIGWMADGIAESEANKRRPQSEAIAAQRIRDRVLPEFNQEVDEQFVNAENDLNKGLYKRLKNVGLYPEETDWSTTDKYLHMNSIVGQPSEPGGGVPNQTLDTKKGLTIHVHESLLNNMFNRMDFAGRKMNDDQVRDELQSFFTKLLGRKVELESSQPADEDVPRVLLFAKQDPIRFRIDEGQVNLVIRSGFEQEGDDDIPTKEIVVPLTFRVDGEQIVIERGGVQVAPVEKPKSVAQHIAHSGVIRKKLEASLPDRTRDRKITIEREGNGPLVLNVTRFKALNGWLTIWAE